MAIESGNLLTLIPNPSPYEGEGKIVTWSGNGLASAFGRGLDKGLSAFLEQAAKRREQRHPAFAFRARQQTFHLLMLPPFFELFFRGGPYARVRPSATKERGRGERAAAGDVFIFPDKA